MSDIFKEVDEEVRRDQALAFWNKHQNNLIALDRKSTRLNSSHT